MKEYFSFITNGSRNVLVRLSKIIAADFAKGEILLEGGQKVDGLRLGQYEYELITNVLSEAGNKDGDSDDKE